MKRNSLLQNAVTGLLIIAVLTIPLFLSVSGQAFITTAVFFNNEVYMIPGASSGVCTYAATMTPGSASDVLTGSLSSDNSGGVVFAIMSTNQFAIDFQEPQLNPGSAPRSGVSQFLKHTCTGKIENSQYHNEGQSFQFQWTVSSNDAYWYVMLNPNSDQMSVALSINRITNEGGMGYSRTSLTNSLTSHESASPSSTGAPEASVTYTPPTISPLSLPFDLTYLAIAVGAIVLVALLLLMRRSSKRQKPSSALQWTPPTMSQRTSQVGKEGFQKQFCVNCGRQIPFGSKFCGKCGAAQTQA